MGRCRDHLREQLGFSRQKKQDCLELAAVPEEEFKAALVQACAEAKAVHRPLTEARVYRILGIGRERRRQNVGSADEIPEHLLAWAADLSSEERRLIQLALQFTRRKT